MPATLKSRIPQIQASLPLRVGAAVQTGTEAMAAAARERAPDRHPYGEGLVESIQARGGEFSYGSRSGFAPLAGGLGFDSPAKDPQTGSDVVSQDAYGVYAAWYYHYLEFGTANAAPRPFLIPAFEATKDEIEAGVAAALRGL